MVGSTLEPVKDYRAKSLEMPRKFHRLAYHATPLAKTLLGVIKFLKLMIIFQFSNRRKHLSRWQWRTIKKSFCRLNDGTLIGA